MVGHAYGLIRSTRHLYACDALCSLQIHWHIFSPYFDDILVFTESLEDHVTRVRAILQTLRNERLSANMEKCTFGVDKLVFLGFVVSSKGVHVDEAKIDVIKTWPQQTNL